MSYLGPLVLVMDFVDRVVSKLCPFVAGGIFIGSVYWTAVTYGAVTVMQVCKDFCFYPTFIAITCKISLQIFIKMNMQ